MDCVHYNGNLVGLTSRKYWGSAPYTTCFFVRADEYHSRLCYDGVRCIEVPLYLILCTHACASTCYFFPVVISNTVKSVTLFICSQIESLNWENFGKWFFRRRKRTFHWTKRWKSWRYVLSLLVIKQYTCPHELLTKLTTLYFGLLTLFVQLLVYSCLCCSWSLLRNVGLFGRNSLFVLFGCSLWISPTFFSFFVL